MAEAAPAPAADEAPRHVTTISYDFVDEAHGKKWFEHFSGGAEDGFAETAGAPGMLVCKLFKHAASKTKYGFYEEWADAASQANYTKARFATGFLAEWLGLDVTLSPPRMTRLAQPGPFVEQGTLVKSSVREGAGEPGGFCVTVNFFFKEQADCDAFIAHHRDAEDGFDASANAPGNRAYKLYKSTETAAGWSPGSYHTSTYAGIYEEWESREAYMSSTNSRMTNGYFARWFGFQPGPPPRMAKLKNETVVLENYLLVQSTPSS